MTIKIEIPAGDREALRAFGEAMVKLSVRLSEAEVLPFARHLHEGEQSITTAGPTRATVEERAEQATQNVDKVELRPSEPLAQENTDAVGSVDGNGVAFDETYCGRAAEPFYTTGKRQGQWKKRKGVDDAAYDNWYASQLGGQASAADAPPTAQDDTPTPPSLFDASAAFAAPQQAPAGASRPPLRSIGDLMAYTSELIAQGAVSEEQVSQAWAKVGVEIKDLMPPADHGRIAQLCGQIAEALGV